LTDHTDFDYSLIKRATKNAVPAATRPKDFADFMMRFELGLEKPNPKRALQSGGTIGGAYIFGGLIGMGESVTWEATHFGITQKLTSKINAFERPKHFRDSMVKGTFRRFDHDHFFEQSGDQTLMKDVFDYDLPLGILGKIADALFLEKYMREMLAGRNRLIKKIAESDDWRKFLKAEARA
jgi:hypothetical protein